MARTTSPAVRSHLFSRIIDELAGGARDVEPVLGKLIAEAEKDYFRALKAQLPTAYRKHLATLDDEQIYKIQWTRRKWSSFVRNGGSRSDFEKGFLDKLRSFAKREATSVYAKAARYCINEGGKPRGALSYFIDQDKEILNFGYPQL